MEKRPPQNIGVVAIEKGAFGSSSINVANFYFTKNNQLLNWRTTLDLENKKKFPLLSSLAEDRSYLDFYLGLMCSKCSC